MTDRKILPGFSVIICCHNSAKRIIPTLEHLAGQNYPGNWEVLLIDNNCTDNTVEVAQKTWNERFLNVPLRIRKEDNPGLGNARWKGIRESKFEYLVFCDDDNWLFSDYLSRAHNILDNNQSVGIIGGNAVPKFENPDHKQKRVVGLAINPQGQKSGDITYKKGHVYGAGAVFRRMGFEKLIEIGFTSLLADRKGNELSSGNDTELCYAFRILGYKIYFEEKLRFYHYVSSNRLSSSYLNRLKRGFEDSFIVLESYANLVNFGYKKWWQSWLKIILTKFILATKRKNIKALLKGLKRVMKIIINVNTYRKTYNRLVSTFFPVLKTKYSTENLDPEKRFVPNQLKN